MLLYFLVVGTALLRALWSLPTPWQMAGPIFLGYSTVGPICIPNKPWQDWSCSRKVIIISTSLPVQPGSKAGITVCFWAQRVAGESVFPSFQHFPKTLGRILEVSCAGPRAGFGDPCESLPKQDLKLYEPVISSSHSPSGCSLPGRPDGGRILLFISKYFK